MKAVDQLASQVGTAAACRSLGVARATVYFPAPSLLRQLPPRHGFWARCLLRRVAGTIHRKTVWLPGLSMVGKADSHSRRKA